MSEIDDDKPVTHGVFTKAFHAMTGKIGQVETKVDRIEESIGQFRSEITGLLQDFAGILENYKRETVTLPNTLDQHGKRLDDHESRIRSLES